MTNDTPDNLKIVKATDSDLKPICNLHAAAFPSASESKLVEAITRNGDDALSLMAISNNKLVGHILFSHMKADFKAVALAPVSTDADYQRKGIAAKLINDGLLLLKEEGIDGVFVLGDPAYYTRFGFSVEAAQQFKTPYDGPYMMFLNLSGNKILKTQSVEYADAFSEL